MRFRDRRQAGDELGRILATMPLEAPIVLGIPRGGVPVAARVARALNCELGVIVARKLRSPFSPELAIGAVTAEGSPWLNHELIRETGANDSYLQREIAIQKDEARRREEAFDGHRTAPVRGRTAIVVDDGVATGATMFAAVRAMRDAGASRVIAAVPVGASETLARLREEADEVVCVLTPPELFAVGMHYDDFSPVEDDAVLAALAAYYGPFTIEDFRVERDGVSLAARLCRPGTRAPLVIFVHGLGSSKESPRNAVVAEALQDVGFATLLFDLSGHGESTPVESPGLDDFAADIAAVFAYARSLPAVDGERIALAGSSLGATAALRAVTAGLVRPATLVLRVPPIEPRDAVGLAVPALLLVGDQDSLLGPAREAARASRAITLVVVPGASHLFEEPGTLEAAARVTTDWLSELLRRGSRAS